MPPGISLNKINPSVIEVALDVPVVKELPVQVDWVGKLPEDMTLSKVTVVPETVKVTGGSKVLEKVGTVYTAPVRLDALARSGTITSPVVLSPPSLKLLANNAEKVLIHYQFAERTAHERK